MHRSVKHPDAPRIIAIQTDVPEAWNTWRFTDGGRYLRSPDGDLITPQRLQGLLWRDKMELRRAGYASRKAAEKQVRHQQVKVVVMDLVDWHARNVGSRAG